VRLCPSPNFNARPTGEISLLVIHNISLPPAQFATGKVQEFFQNRLDVTEHPYFEGIADLRVSAHFLIERDGTVTQFVSCLERAWHAGVSSFEGGRPVTIFPWESSSKARMICRSPTPNMTR
jgi:AmpD protein